MSIWMVIYIAGKVAATLGPVPADMAGCQAVLPHYMARIDYDKVQQMGYSKHEVSMKCVEHEGRPPLAKFEKTSGA